MAKTISLGTRSREADIRLWVTIVRHTFRFEFVISGFQGLSSLPLLRFASTQSIIASSNVISAQFEAVTRLSTGLIVYSFHRQRELIFFSSSWLQKLYWNDSAFKEVDEFEHIKVGYYWPQSLSSKTM